MRRPAALIAAAILALAGSTESEAHEGGSHSGFAARVSVIEPFLPGLLVQVVNGHTGLSVANLTKKTIVILDESGRPFVRIPPGRTEVWDEPRVGANEDPPAREGLVRNWVIEGTADGEPFAIRGFLGYRPPAGVAEADDSGVPVWILVLALPAVLLIVGVLLVARRTRE